MATKWQPKSGTSAAALIISSIPQPEPYGVDGNPTPRQAPMSYTACIALLAACAISMSKTSRTLQATAGNVPGWR